MVDMTAAEQMDTLRAHPAYDLNTGDWASVCAEHIVRLVGGYLDEAPLGNPVLDEGLTDGAEVYVRACRQVSPSVSLELMLTAAYAYAGALAAGGLWVHWNGRGTRQVCPATEQVIGLAPSGVGKSSQQKLLNLAYGPAESLHIAAVQSRVSEWAGACQSAVDAVLAEDAAKLTPGGDAEEFAEFTKAKKTVKKLVGAVDMDVSSGVKLTYSDATAEALVSSAINYGGSAFIRSAEQDVLDNLSRYSANGSGASLSMYTDGWDGAAYSRDRKGSGFEYTSAFVLSMSLMTQNESFVKAFATSGDGWLGKGLLGRAWLVRGVEMDIDQMLAEDEARRRAGVVPVPVPYGLAQGLAHLADIGAGPRAVRMIHDRLARKARDAGAEASVYLKKALVACTLEAGEPVTVESIARTGGLLPGQDGVALEVKGEAAGRLEDLHAWILRSFALVGREDPVLAPVVTRLSYHIARLAGLRSVMMGVDDAVDFDVLVDTACRLVPWLLHLHLRCLGGMIRGLHMEEVRADLVQARGRDLSMGGLIMEALKSQPDLQFPLSVSRAIDMAARGRKGAREYRDGIREYFNQEYERQVVLGEPGDGYFTMKAGHRKGDKLVAGFAEDTLINVTPVAMAQIKNVS